MNSNRPKINKSSSSLGKYPAVVLAVEVAGGLGFLYGMSKRAMQLVAEEPLPSNNNDEAWVTAVLGRAGIKLQHDPRYVMYTGQRDEFIPNKPKVLRAPPRARFTPVDTVRLDAAHAYCMFFNWTGHRNTSDERVVAEMRKVFNEYVVCR